MTVTPSPSGSPRSTSNRSGLPARASISARAAVDASARRNRSDSNRALSTLRMAGSSYHQNPVHGFCHSTGPCRRARTLGVGFALGFRDSARAGILRLQLTARWCRRQRELEMSTPRGSVAGGNLPAVLTHDGPADRKAEPDANCGALIRAALEFLEESCRIPGR